MQRTRKYAISLFLLVSIYPIASLIGGFVHVGEEKQGEFTIFVSSGQIHTEFVFDLQSSPVDWSNLIPFSLVNPKIESARYISVGWGDRRFFYELLEWSDLTFDLAFSSVFLPGESAVHVEYANELNPSLKHYKIQINEGDYLKLYEFIKNSFKLENGRPIKIDEFNYYENDRFFYGVGSYHMFNTCNMWTHRGLAIIDAQRPLWSPFKWGIDYVYE